MLSSATDSILYYFRVLRERTLMERKKHVKKLLKMKYRFVSTTSKKYQGLGFFFYSLPLGISLYKNFWGFIFQDCLQMV